MKLYLKNHTERYPVEQLQLQLFAQEPSEFCTEPFTGDGTVSSLSRGKRYLTATAKVTYQGKTGFAVNRVLLDRADVRATRRILQRSYSGCFAGASGCAALGRALRRQADKTVDEMPDGGRQRKGRGKASARGLFCLAGAGEALR